MPQKTNLNVNPYYEDFDASKNFYKILFRPGYSIQSRELTQVQSILQNQLESFGKYAFKQGELVIPGEVGLNTKLDYVKLSSVSEVAVSEGDERRAIDTIMTKLRSLVEETGAGIVLVSHLRRVDGNKGHENGVEVSLSHLRGSNSIGQLSDCVIALERNQQSDDIDEARTTRVRVLKSRYTGDVGLATHLLYDGETGRLSEIDTSDIKVDLNDEGF